uniref:Uncharacterized protein n=1 Tax=Anguilla anguilla TaxID=7936 RepID=A0A0E9PIW2_ANGAN
MMIAGLSVHLGLPLTNRRESIQHCVKPGHHYPESLRCNCRNLPFNPLTL